MQPSEATSSDLSIMRREMLEDCLMSHPDGIALLDDSGTFIFSNTRYNEMFFDKNNQPRPGETALQVVRRIIDSDRVVGLDQVDPDHAALNMVIDCFSFVQGAEFALKNGRIIQINSSPTKDGRIMMTFRDTRRDRLGERRAAELLSEGLGSADMGMVLWDAALKVQMVNAAWQDMTQPLGIGDDVSTFFRSLADGNVLPVPNGAEVGDFVRETIAAIHARPMQFLLGLKDGRHVQLSTFGMTSGGVLATSVDISQQHDAEERARALLRDAVEALEIGVLHFDADLKLLMINRAAKGMMLSDQATPDKDTWLSDIIGNLINTGVIRIPEGPTRMDVIASFENGTRSYEKQRRVTWENGRTFEFSAYPTEMGGYLVSMQELTDKVRADREAREAHELVKTIVDASPTTFLVSKVDTGEVVYSTDASRERFGDIKSTLSFFLDPEHRKTYLAALLPTGELNDYPVRFRRGDGTIMDGLTSARIIEYQSEKMIVSSTRDITDFLRMQRELEVQRRHALQNEKLSALGELLAGVAHELSNPLSVVVGYAMMLRDEAEDGPFLRKLDRIAIAADRCVRIVKMFLALAREKPTTLETCKINDLLKTAVAVSSSGIDESGGYLELQMPQDLPFISVDPDHITQVLSNLVVNAGHAVRDLGKDGRVTVRAYGTPRDAYVTVEVEDNGSGVPEDIQTRIFEPFFTTKDVGSGTGIGLAFSHRVISAHNGTLTLEASQMGGALFRIRLPVAQQSTHAREENETSAQVLLSAPHVLVLDDDNTVLEVVRDVLEQKGFLVRLCSKGTEALNHCEIQSYDAILCDMRMPDMDGEEFFSALSQIRPHLAERVIFLTGDTMNPKTAAFLETSDRPNVEKPIMPSELLAQVSLCAAQERS